MPGTCASCWWSAISVLFLGDLCRRLGLAGYRLFCLAILGDGFNGLRQLAGKAFCWR
ncbi:hypothetical protein LAD77_00720 [Klebsiella pneumoniae]|nr:hypothetical protein [Klebsiella pneumoniae]